MTEQPKLSKNCKINDVNVDKEILSQLTQNCNGDVRYTSSEHGTSQPPVVMTLETKSNRQEDTSLNRNDRYSEDHTIQSKL